MKIAGIICEYNPLQRGHVYHISRAVKDVGAEKVICIMSGNFTQRGELAVADKYTRATWAIKSGADMVIELPPQYVLTAAKYFALGGVKIANTISGNVTLSFGSEIGDLATLKNIADLQENDDFKSALNSMLEQGNGYAKSYAYAIAKISPKYSDVLLSPNNILAVEYIKALGETNSSVTPYTLHRVGSGYHQTCTNEYPSASGIRSMWQNNDLSGIAQGTPQYVYEYLKEFNPQNYNLSYAKLFSLLKYNSDSIDLKSIHGVKEGIENRITAALKECEYWQDFVDRLSTKRYTNAYLLRTLINILISNTHSATDLKNQKIEYVNVLAVEQNSKDLLSSFDCRVITKSSDLPDGCLILRADNLYSSVRNNIPQYMQIVKR